MRCYFKPSANGNLEKQPLSLVKKISLVYTMLIFSLCLAGVFTIANAQNSLSSRITSSKDQAEMILIPAGEFVFGMNQQDVSKLVIQELKEPMIPFYESEIAERTENLDAFYIDRYEVTNEQYDRFIKDTKYKKIPKYKNWPQFNKPRQPVVGIGWEDAEAYAKWAGKRLPTEEEWEKAARGTKGFIWPWGNKRDNDNFNGRKQSQHTPVDVGSFPESNSPFGLGDMAGNVWEMTSGKWSDPKSGTDRTMKGGSFLNTKADVRTTVRWAPADPANGANWLGFRCVMDVNKVGENAKPRKE